MVDRGAALKTGLVICGKWQIAHLLGSGGMGRVFAASHRNGKRVAIKVLHAELHANPHLRARFLREGYIANRVDHVDVVSVLDDGETEDGEAFLVMDLLTGETLDARRKRTPLSTDEALRIAERVLDVLANAHDRGIVHRDIKPANIFLTDTNGVKVLDFGIASICEALNESESGTLTPTGASLGTPAFMSPEQARGRWDLVDGRTDLWAVGAVLFTLLTGRLVHEGLTPNEQIIAAATAPAPPITSLLRALPAPVAAIVDRALALDCERRWQNARDMRRAIQAFLGTLPLESATSPPFVTVHEGQAWVHATQASIALRSVVSRSPRRKRLLVPFALSAGVLLSGLALLSFYHPPATTQRLASAASLQTAPLAAAYVPPGNGGIGLDNAAPSVPRAEPAAAAASDNRGTAPPKSLSRSASKARNAAPLSAPASPHLPARAAPTAPPAADADWLDRQQ